jgi:malate dehydrogenase (oxaloacetate-decarboxylating)
MPSLAAVSVTFLSPFLTSTFSLSAFSSAFLRSGFIEGTFFGRPFGQGVGVSGQPGAFSEAVIRSMAASVARPVIFPLSNPTSRAEATPQDLMIWTDGKAVIGTGSPFPPVLRNGSFVRVDQTNNSYVFPGIGLAAIAVRARRISDEMLMAAARALAHLSPARQDPVSNLLPSVTEARDVSARVAEAVAMQACKEGLTEPIGAAEIFRRIEAKIWTPVYRPYQRRAET